MTGSARIAVVGGSIGGLTAGVLLRDAGYEVEIFERSPVLLSGFGAGIVVQPELVRYFLERTEVTLDRISVPSSSMRYFEAATGRLVGEIEADWRYTSYNALYRGLLDRFGLDQYRLGETLVGLDQSADGVELRFASGRTERCDLAVCADGGFSVARHRLFGVLPRYAGYISWRGTTPRDRLSAEAWDFFADRFSYGLLPDSHAIAYPIPIVTDELQVVGQHVNFQWYWNVPEGPELDEMMTDRDGIRRPVSVHPDGVQQRYLDELERRAREQFAVDPFIELFGAADNRFVTVIADADVQQMFAGRVCLIGDAAITGRPHAAAGAAKAAANAWALAEALVAHGDIDEALRAWEPDQLKVGYALLAKVRYMASRLQHGVPFVPGEASFRFGLPTAT